MHHGLMSYFRPELTKIPSYVPGKPTTDATVIKLSSNELPFEPLASVQEAIATHTDQVNRYPDMVGAHLCADIAAHVGVAESQVVISCGSVQMIEKVLAASSTPSSNVVVSELSFEAYPIAITSSSATRVAVPALADGGHDLDAMAAAVNDDTSAILVCSPNNPTGHAISHTDLVAFLDKVGDKLVILDEAYIDFVTSDDPIRSLELLETYPGLVILRTFSKAFGLAGLRVGYAIASEENARVLRAVATPFGVSTIAQAAAAASLGEYASVKERVSWVISERERVKEALAGLVEIPDSQANFVWFAGYGPDFADHCAREGIIVRALPAGVRVTVAEKEGNDRLIAALTSWVTSTP